MLTNTQKKQDCCGCMACSFACPKSAIQMKTDLLTRKSTRNCASTADFAPESVLFRKIIQVLMQFLTFMHFRTMRKISSAKAPPVVCFPCLQTGPSSRAALFTALPSTRDLKCAICARTLPSQLPLSVLPNTYRATLPRFISPSAQT